MDSVLIGGRFRLHRLLGSGAMGQVWLATDERLERSVAVKVVIPDAADTQLGKRLEREARAAAAIQHTNVVRVFDYIEVAEGQTLIVMEYVEGETLADRIERTGPLPLEDALDIMSQICDGLTAAHRVNLVHRDLKPSNVMVTTDGVAKVLDFGIAKQTGGRKESALTMTGAVIGTPRYMAPEQLTGEELSPQADVHAAGLLMYEMLSGVPAFDRENIAELMYQLLHASPDMRPLEARGVPAEVMAILEKALQKRPENRWPSARAMADALKVSLYGDVIRARNTPSSAGLRAIIDSGERTLSRSDSGEATLSAGAATPIAVTPVPVTMPMVTAAAVAPVTAMSEPIVERRAPREPEPSAPPKKSSNVPLVVVPALVLAAVAAFVFFKMRGGETPPATPAVAGAQSADTGVPATGATATTPEAPPATQAAAEPIATPAAPPVAAANKAADDSARAADARSNEIVRRALAAEVESQWRVYIKRVTPELGDDIGDLKADFTVLVNQAGQLADVRTGTLSEEAVFNDNASQALQSADAIKVGSSRRPGGWTMRVRFVGKSVRVSVR